MFLKTVIWWTLAQIKKEKLFLFIFFFLSGWSWKQWRIRKAIMGARSRPDGEKTKGNGKEAKGRTHTCSGHCREQEMWKHIYVVQFTFYFCNTIIRPEAAYRSQGFIWLVSSAKSVTEGSQARAASQPRRYCRDHGQMLLPGSPTVTRLALCFTQSEAHVYGILLPTVAPSSIDDQDNPLPDRQQPSLILEIPRDSLITLGCTKLTVKS